MLYCDTFRSYLRQSHTGQIQLTRVLLPNASMIKWVHIQFIGMCSVLNSAAFLLNLKHGINSLMPFEKTIMILWRVII